MSEKEESNKMWADNLLVPTSHRLNSYKLERRKSLKIKQTNLSWKRTGSLNCFHFTLNLNCFFFTILVAKLNFSKSNIAVRSRMDFPADNYSRHGRKKCASLRIILWSQSAIRFFFSFKRFSEGRGMIRWKVFHLQQAHPFLQTEQRQVLMCFV